MDDLKSVTLDYLRELARKHLGPGHSKLNKRELIAQLAEFVPALKKLAKLAGVELPTQVRPAAKVAAASTKSTREPRGKEARVADKKEPESRKAPVKKASERKKEPEPRREPEKKAAEKKVAERTKEPKPEPRKEPEKKAAERKKEPEAQKEPEPRREPEKKAAAPQGRKAAPPRQAAQKDEDLSQSMRPAQVVNFPPRPRHPRSAEEEWAESSEVVDSPELESVFQHAAEPLMEGFFVARLMGERELRRHHLTEEQSPRGVGTGSAGLEEELGELPLDYGNDLAVALARDPHTLFLTWDFSAATLARACEGLEAPRAILRVFDGDRLVRELEFAPESRSFYIHGLPPGRPYRVEAHFIGIGGLSRRLGHSTRPLALPHTGPSRDTSVRFMQMPPPPRVQVSAPPPEEVAASTSPETTVEEREYITWRRVALPGSDEMASVAESRRQRIERQAREGAGPSERREYLEVAARPPGSSDQVPARGPARAQEYIEVTARPPGSSEQFPARGPSREGASEPSHWMPPPSGRGR